MICFTFLMLTQTIKINQIWKVWLFWEALIPANLNLVPEEKVWLILLVSVVKIFKSGNVKDHHEQDIYFVMEIYPFTAIFLLTF